MIYAFVHPDTLEVRYIGKAKNPENRIRSHAANAHRSKKNNYPIYRWWRKLERNGHGSPCMVLLGEGESAEEREWIARLKQNGARLLNLTEGGDGWGYGKENPMSRNAPASARPPSAFRVAILRRYSENPELKFTINQAASAPDARKRATQTYRKTVSRRSPERSAEIGAKISATKTPEVKRRAVQRLQETIRRRSPERRAEIGAKISAGKKAARKRGPK